MFRRLRTKYVRTRLSRRYFCRPEILERRMMLSASPAVIGIEVASTSWSSAFVSSLQNINQLGEEGYAIPLGSPAQSASLTWINLNQIKIRFNQDVIVQAADLSVSGINNTCYGFSGFHYDPQAHLATWTLTTPLDRERIHLDLDSGGSDPVTNMNGDVLDGEWTNNTSTMSGNGTAGGDFQFTFNVLPTDVNNTGNITSADYVYIRQLDGKTVGSAGYIAKRDIDGSGLIDSTDWQEAVDRYFESLPSGLAAGINNDAPTTNGFARVEILNAAVDASILLTEHFGDTESGSSGLTYSILSNSAPSLFDTAFINATTQQLVFNAASGVTGRATIVVRAIDSGGLIVDTNVTVDVARENERPVIDNLFIEYLGGGAWYVSGDVYDPDDDTSDLLVYFSNVFETRCSVDEEGHFEFVVYPVDGEDGYESVKAYDPHVLTPVEYLRYMDIT